MSFASPLLGRAPSRGNLGIRKNGRQLPIFWRLRNSLRLSFLTGLLAVFGARLFSRITGLPVLTSELRVVKVSADGEKTDYGVVSYKVVTDVGADKIALAFNAGYTLANFNYHGVGTGVGAEAAGDTALGTESTTILNPNTTRATGTQSNPASKQYRSVGTPVFDGSGAITEHGLFSASTSGDLFDRSVFSAINVVNGDSIAFTYTLSITSGG